MMPGRSRRLTPTAHRRPTVSPTRTKADRSRRALVAGVLAVAATACGGGGADTGPGTPIKIAVLDYQTGPLARKGQSDSIKMAVEEINAAGGVAGRKIRLSFYDLGAPTPQNARSAAQKALSDRPVVMFGPSTTAQVNAIVDLVAQAKVPLLHKAQGPDEDPGGKHGNPWVFRAQSRGDRSGMAIARTVAEKVKAKRVVVTHSTDDLTTALAGYVTKNLEARGVRVTRVVKYTPDATDLTNPALATRGVDAVAALGYPQPVALLIKQMRANGITIPLVSASGAESIVLGKLVPAADLKDTMFLGGCEPMATAAKEPAAGAFVRAFTRKHPGSYMDAYYYDAVKVVAEAVKKTGGDLDPAKLRGALAGIRGYQGVCGDWSADARQNFLHSEVIVTMDGGKEGYGGRITGLTGSYA